MRYKSKYLQKSDKYLLGILFFTIFLIVSPVISANEDENLTFIALGHVYPDYDALNLSISLIEKEDPDFVVFLGDSVTSGTEESWEELLYITDQINVPIYFVPGNHEIQAQPEGQGLFKEYSSEDFFWEFTMKNNVFVVLNSVQEVYEGEKQNYDVSEEQTDFIKEIYSRDNKNKFIFLHHCLFYNYDNQFCNWRGFFETNEWNDKIVPVIKNETIAVFVGDTGLNEPYFGYIENDISYFGVGFSPEGTQLKIPQHMLKVVLKEEKLTVTPIPIRQDITQVKYVQRVDKTFFPLFKAFVKKNLALVLNLFSLVIFLLVLVILFLLMKIKKS